MSILNRSGRISLKIAHPDQLYQKLTKKGEKIIIFEFEVKCSLESWKVCGRLKDKHYTFNVSILNHSGCLSLTIVDTVQLYQKLMKKV